MHPLDSWTATQVSEIGCQITRTLLHRVDEVSQLLNEVGHLLCEAGQLLYSWSSNSCWTAIMGCGRLPYKSRPSV